ncbi:TetR/AcrR family transcriptional regulator [Marinicrinis lubricantis]|uniref:TetR/AcrR family transcriptional regulator n=1 Tax=Marinicrinis lubricantis TaxID=2086470 RepID=A0ABW1IRW6_9BACL
MKENIIQAVTKEIHQRGLRFSIRDVASQLGISTKTVYQHFESKEQMISSIVEHAVKDMMDIEKEVMANDTLSLQEKLYRALTVLPRRFVFQDVRILDELRQRYPQQWKVLDDYMNNGWNGILLLVEQGVEEGALKPFDMELFISVYVGALYQLMDQKRSDSRRMSLEEALAGMVDFLMYGITKQSPGKSYS